MQTRKDQTTQKNKRKPTMIWASILVILGVLLLSFIFMKDGFGGSADGQEHEAKDADRVEGAGVDHKEVPEYTEADMEDLSDEIIEALDERDMEAVATYVHDEAGLIFSPYVYVEEDAVLFAAEDVASMLDSSEPLVWGNYDGEGSPIELTPEEFFEEFLDMTPFLEANDVLVDDLQDRGNTTNNIAEAFPDARVVEYYNDGSEEYAGIDWESVNLVYEENEVGQPQLVALIRDMWTI